MSEPQTEAGRALLDVEQRVELAREMGRIQAEKDAFKVLAAIVAAAGGEVRVPDHLVIGDVLMHTDYLNGETVYRAVDACAHMVIREKQEACRKALADVRTAVNGLVEPTYDGDTWTKDSEHGWTKHDIAVLAAIDELVEAGDE